jgi:hypothetical protein
MNTSKRKEAARESLYALLTRSEEVKREYFETIVYALVVLSAIAAIVQFAMQRDPLPLITLPDSLPLG